MVLFNYSTKEITAKIVYYGPGLCGKTTNLQFVYDNLPRTINKGKMLSLATKTDRTLFFDFLPIDLGTIRGMRTRLQLYTVPGQVFYNTTRKLVLKGADGVVFVADSQKRMLDANLESLKNLEENLAEHDMKLAETPLIIQFNKRDLPDVAGVEELNTALNRFNAPIYEAVATTGIGVHETLKAITRLVLNSLKERYADKREQRAEPAPGVAAAALAAAQARAQSAAPAPRPARHAEPLAAAAAAPAAATGMPAEDHELMLDTDAPTLDFALPEQGARPGSALSTPMAGEPALDPFPLTGHQEGDPGGSFDLSPGEPLELMAGAASGNDAGAARETAAAEAGILEPAFELEVEGEDVFELMEEPAPAPTRAPAGPEPPALELADQPVSAEQDFAADETPADDFLEPVPVAAADHPLGEYDSMEADLLESAEPPPGIISMEMPGLVDLVAPAQDAAPASPPAPARPAAAEAAVLEDHHDEALAWSAEPLDEPAMTPHADGAPAPEPVDLTPRRSITDTPLIPFVPTAPVEERPAGVRSAPAPQPASQEIHLPIRLDIAGQIISFDLRISLDLTTGTAGIRLPGQGDGGRLG